MADKGVTQIDESILRSVKAFGASSEKIAELRNRAFPSVAAAMKYKQQAQSGQQISRLLRVMKMGSQMAKKNTIGTLKATVTDQLISFDISDVKDKRERAFWRNYQRMVRNAPESGTLPGGKKWKLSKTQVQTLRDFKERDKVSLNPALLKVLAIGYLSQATGRGVPQAFEAQELAKQLGEDLPLTEAFSRATGSLETAIGVIRSSINGELLENSTIDLGSMSLSGGAK